MGGIIMDTEEYSYISENDIKSLLKKQDNVSEKDIKSLMKTRNIILTDEIDILVTKNIKYTVLKKYSLFLSSLIRIIRFLKYREVYYIIKENPGIQGKTISMIMRKLGYSNFDMKRIIKTFVLYDLIKKYKIRTNPGKYYTYYYVNRDINHVYKFLTNVYNIFNKLIPIYAKIVKSSSGRYSIRLDKYTYYRRKYDNLLRRNYQLQITDLNEFLTHLKELQKANTPKRRKRIKKEINNYVRQKQDEGGWEEE